MDRTVHKYAHPHFMENYVLKNVIVRIHLVILCMDVVPPRVHVSPMVLRIISMINVSCSLIKL